MEVILIVLIALGLMSGIAVLCLSDIKKIKYGLGLTFLVVSFLSLVFLSYNAYLADNYNIKSMDIVTSGISIVSTDCYGRLDIRVNGINLRDPAGRDDRFFLGLMKTGDGEVTDKINFVEGKNYTIYKQNGFILHNYIVVCDK